MRLFSFIIAFFVFSNSYSQVFYKTSGGELIFSRSISNSPVENSSSKFRVSAFLNYNQNYHLNFTPFLGSFSGFAISNVGFAYQSGDTVFKKRAYTFGIPLGIKLGNVNNDRYMFIGGEIEIPIHFKQKKMFDYQKDKNASFFDKRMNSFLPSVFAGMQFSGGISFKLKLYLKDFLDPNFKGMDFGLKTNYKSLDSRLFLISLSYNIKETKIKRIIRNSGNDRFASLNI